MKDRIRRRIDALRPLLHDPAAEVRRSAAEAIEKLEAISCVDDILVTLKSGDMGARVGAIYALGEIGGERVVPPLAYCAQRPEVDLRSAAAAALGKLALPAALPVLVTLLDDEDPTVQARAIASLGRFSVSQEIVLKLRTFLGATDGVLEAEAALTLAALNDLHSLQRIHALFKSSHASTRQAAVAAFSRMPLQ
jgi:HEAT repeat protein